MKQPNSLVQISVNDVNLDSLSECAGQILAKEEAVLVIGGHLQHSSLLDKQKIYQAFRAAASCFCSKGKPISASIFRIVISKREALHWWRATPSSK